MWPLGGLERVLNEVLNFSGLVGTGRGGGGMWLRKTRGQRAFGFVGTTELERERRKREIEE